jgi:hypothetical protein
MSDTNNKIDTSIVDERNGASLLGRLTDLAWAAGFVDGEGCITVVNQTYRPKNGKQRPPTTRFKFVINQNCRSTLDRLQKILNETGYLNEVPFTEGLNRRSYTLHYDGKHALRAIKKLEPYLYRKRQYVHVAEKLFEEGKLGQRPGRSGWDKETLKAREKWMTRIRRLH